MLICTVSEKIIVNDCPDSVEIVGNHSNVNVWWTPPTAELLTINGTTKLERNVLSSDTYKEPGDLFPVGNTQVEYRYESKEATASCIFTVSVGNYYALYIIYQNDMWADLRGGLGFRFFKWKCKHAQDFYCCV